MIGRPLVVGEWVNTDDGMGRIASITPRHEITNNPYPKPIVVQFRGEAKDYASLSVHRASFLEFVFNGPNKGKGFGLTPMWTAIAIHGFGLLISASSVFAVDMTMPWRVFTGLFGVGLIALLWIKTHDNFTRKTV